MSAVCNNAPVSRNGARRTGGPSRVRHAGLLAVLLALSVLTAIATTTTSSSGRTPADNFSAITAAATAVNSAGHGETDSSVDPSSDVQRDGSDTTVSVVRKVRGILLPHGIVPPTLVLADITPQQRVLTTHGPAPRAAVQTHAHLRRGPPAAGVRPLL